MVAAAAFRRSVTRGAFVVEEEKKTLFSMIEPRRRRRRKMCVAYALETAPARIVFFSSARKHKTNAEMRPSSLL